MGQQKEHAVERAQRIYRVIRQCAEQGLPCPTNLILAERFGCGTGTIVDAIAFLEANGLFTVKRTNDRRTIIFRDGIETAPRATHRAGQFPSDTKKRRK
jgi:hypothetical protein